jgi:shikimate kinase
MSTPENIILCGFMGTGKTTVGELLAERLGWRFVDTDSLIETRLGGRPISQIFAEEGEAFFRRWESRICEELVRSKHEVIATGGGLVLNPANRAALNRAGMVVCLEAPADEIVARLHGATDRPLLAGADPLARIRELLATRAEAYSSLPYHIDTAGCSPEQVARQVLALWRKYRAASQ